MKLGPVGMRGKKSFEKQIIRGVSTCVKVKLRVLIPLSALSKMHVLDSLLSRSFAMWEVQHRGNPVLRLWGSTKGRAKAWFSLICNQRR